MAAAAALGLAGCDFGGGGGGGGSSWDFGSNDTAVVVCIGDSITEGTCAPAGAPYPSRLGAMSGKSVANEGVCGALSDDGVGRVGGLLKSYKPGYLCIFYGANDATRGHSVSDVIANLRSMVQSAKSNKTLPLIATLLPMYDSHGLFDGNAEDISNAIRTMAKEEGARLVDLRAEFGSDRTLIQEDGLHPSDTGTQIIAAAFNDKI